MHLSETERRNHLRTLAEAEGFETAEDMLGNSVIDSVAHAICTTCGFTAVMEPDQDRGYCEACGCHTVVSALILAGLVREAAMDIQTADKTARIGELNDDFRRSFVGGTVVLTAGVDALSTRTRSRILARVRNFDEFDADNDPHREHDFCAFSIDGVKVFAKIDYYDRDIRYGSPDPSDPKQTTRVLTVMLAEEY